MRYHTRKFGGNLTIIKNLAYKLIPSCNNNYQAEVGNRLIQ